VERGKLYEGAMNITKT